MGRTPRESARQVETRLTLEEWFDDFKTMQSLQLPTQWMIRYTVEGAGGTTMSKWEMNFSRALHNMSMNPKLFVLN